MSEEQKQPTPETGEKLTGLKALWNKPLKMSDKEIEKLRKKGKEIKQKTVGSETISWIVTILTAVVLALVIRTFLFEIYGVDGRSMTNTLQDHEKLFCESRKSGVCQAAGCASRRYGDHEGSPSVCEWCSDR